MDSYSAIPDLIARIQSAVDAEDPDTFADCWTENATLTLFFVGVREPLRLSGRNAIVEMASSGFNKGSLLRHLPGTISVQPKGENSARVQSYAMYLTPGDDAPGVGYYDDEVVRDDSGQWRVERRVHQFLNPIDLGAGAGDNDGH